MTADVAYNASAQKGTKMKPTPPPPRVTHAVLAIDPGITTGWALLDPAAPTNHHSSDILGTAVWGTAELKHSLDLVIRTCFTNGTSLEAVIEQMPPGFYGELARKLERVRAEIEEIIRDTYEIPITYISPGEWKPSRVARTTRLPWKWNGTNVVTHQKDALRMGRYAIDKRREKR